MPVSSVNFATNFCLGDSGLRGNCTSELIRNQASPYNRPNSSINHDGSTGGPGVVNTQLGTVPFPSIPSSQANHIQQLATRVQMLENDNNSLRSQNKVHKTGNFITQF